jgi:hypothetical protein
MLIAHSVCFNHLANFINGEQLGNLVLDGDHGQVSRFLRVCWGLALWTLTKAGLINRSTTVLTNLDFSGKLDSAENIFDFCKALIHSLDFG